ncbi:MAG: ribonuclease III [Bacteriovoracaceae bacterium]|nr:ribonuclease III [Bacteriovoracaceae bacterium]
MWNIQDENLGLIFESIFDTCVKDNLYKWAIVQKTTFKPNSNERVTTSCLAVQLVDFFRKNNKTTSDDFTKFVLSFSGSKSLLELLDYRFQNEAHFIESLIHTSFVHENLWTGFHSNEKLEFLGDAVLDILVSKLLLNKYPDFQEGNLSKMRSALVNEKMLAGLARSMCIGDVLILGRGEISVEGWRKDGLLADAFEALLGAVFLDGGYEAAQSVFDRVLVHYRETSSEDYIHVSRLDDFDAKSRLQEILMQQYKLYPEYRSTGRGNSVFEVELLINGEVIAKTCNISKKRAEKDLARKVLEEELYKGVNHVTDKSASGK